MRIPCPLCGLRDLREFTVKGGAEYLDRPTGEDAADWDTYLHLRANPAGRTKELWYHSAGCASWLVVERDTTTHEVYGVSLAEANDG